MKVREIYKKYKIPPHLRQHLLRVTKVALFICDHWNGNNVDKETIKKTALLHDLGNLVKCDLVQHSEFFGEEKKRLDYWLQIQKEMIKKYGADDYEATIKILKELRVNPSLLSLISSKGFDDATGIEKSDDWELKILFYSDGRVGPYGVLPLRKRLNEAIPRLKMDKELLNLDELVKACFQIEKQIQDNLDVDISEITDESIERDDNELLKTEV